MAMTTTCRVNEERENFALGRPTMHVIHGDTSLASCFIAIRTGSYGFLFNYFPIAPTSTFRVIWPITNKIQITELALPSSEQVRFVLDFYGFSKSELARIIGITRPALYAWLDGKSEPSSENAERLTFLFEAAYSIDPKPKQPIFHGYIERLLSGRSRSLIEELMETSYDKDALRSLIAQTYRMSIERSERITDHQGSPDEGFMSTIVAQERNLEENIMAIGIEG